MAEFDDHEAGNKLARAFDYIEEEETHFVNFDDENEEFGVFRALMVEDSDEDGYLIARAFEYIEEEDEEEEAQFVNLDEETDFFGNLRALMEEDSDDDDDDDDDEVISENKDRREGTLWRRVSAVGARSFEVKSSAGSNLTDTETDDGPNFLQADKQFQEKEKEVNIQKEIPSDEKLCDQHFEKELPTCPSGNDMSDASFNTQLAAEVMKSLLYAPPPITDVKNFNQTELNLESLTENVKKSCDKPLKAVTKRKKNLEDDVVKQPRKKPKNSLNRDIKKRNKIRERKSRKGAITKDDKVIRLPNPMTGFGTPTVGNVITHRTLPEAAIAPPYFYYENVARATKGVWDKISRFLYDVQPEFVDSKYFCAAARKRGYIHNLPIKNRFPLEPLPPQTITDALPLTKRWWPKWDKRNKLNCLQTVLGSAKVTERIRKALEKEDDGPSQHVQKYVIEECRKWNLVWIGKNKVATLEPDEVEMLLGFPRNHTRGGGISRTNRYKSLGNSFQVDTVAYHLSVLKDIFPKGINMLSLFSGIGGAEVALHRLGIPLNNVVSVEISEANRDIVRSWWEQTNQKGKLVHLTDVQEVNDDCLKQLMGSFGGFDLVVGGSPCNNLAGSNRVSRDGLEGEQSSLFYDYFRILDSIKRIMNNKQ